MPILRSTKIHWLTFFELGEVLRSKEPELTFQELNIMDSCWSKLMRGLTVGCFVGTCASWIATRRLNTFSRVNLSAGGGCLFGLWRSHSSLHSDIDHILSMEGTRMQEELSKIIVHKYGDDPPMLRLVSKHFYPEEVIDDSTTDKPTIRWRHRNLCIDNVSDSQKTTENKPQNPSSNKQTDMEPKKVSVNLDINMTADPLDCIFGYSASQEDIHRPDTTSTKPKTHSLSHKRLHRRRARQQQEMLQNSNMLDSTTACLESNSQA